MDRLPSHSGPGLRFSACCPSMCALSSLGATASPFQVNYTQVPPPNKTHPSNCFPSWTQPFLHC